jgi:hypothetical protein
MRLLEFIQYCLPGGRRKPASCEVSDEMGAMADKIIEKGFRFECEILRSGEVSLTISDPEEERDVCIKICENGPKVNECRDALIREGYELLVTNEVKP